MNNNVPVDTASSTASNKLIVICGLSFAGKSTLGRALAKRFGFAEVDVDETKVRLFGPDVWDTDLSRDEWRTIYSATDEELLGHLRTGKTVVDASRNFRRNERVHAKQIAESANVGLLTIFVDTPVAIARQRWQHNRLMAVRRDVSDQDFENLVVVFERPTDDEQAITYFSNEAPEHWIERNSQYFS